MVQFYRSFCFKKIRHRKWFVIRQFLRVDSKFASSGREDVDVRMLGNGRPFTVELINPRISNVPFDKVRKLENEINEAGTNLIFIRDLQIVNRYDKYVSRESFFLRIVGWLWVIFSCRTELANLRNGEDNKTKNYTCLCKMRRKCDVNHLRSLLPTTPFVIQQKTPIRVLHRRTVATRPKTIFELSLEVMNSSSLEGILFQSIIVCIQLGLNCILVNGNAAIVVAQIVRCSSWI